MSVTETLTGKEEWNSDLEQVVKREGEQSQSLYWLHNEASTWSLARNDYIQIPTIVLASVTGFLSATSTLVPPIGIGAMSLTVGILGTLNSYFKYSQRSESHKVTAQLYLKTYKNIETELSLPVHQRENADTLLKELRHTMTRISEIAPPIPSNIIEKYNRIFKDSKVSAPIITNGIESIHVCKQDPSLNSIPSLEPVPTPFISNPPIQQAIAAVNKPAAKQWPSAVQPPRRQINIVTT
jgi:hypothetical protein